MHHISMKLLLKNNAKEGHFKGKSENRGETHESLANAWKENVNDGRWLIGLSG